MSLHRRLALLSCSVLGLLAACNSDNVSWSFVSNPGWSGGTGDGGAIIVIRSSSSSAATSTGSRWVTVPGVDDAGAVTVSLAVGAELAVIERPGEVELRAPVLPVGRLRLPGATALRLEQGSALAEIAFDALTALDARATGPGRLLATASGTAIVVEHRAGVACFGDGAPRYHPAGCRIEERGDALWVRLPDGRLERVLARPAPSLGDHFRRPAAGRIELLGPGGTVLAALPEERCTLHHGEHGLFLTAAFPDGVGGDRTPTTLTVAAGDRHLLRVDER